MLGIPCLDALDAEIDLGTIASDGKSRTLPHSLSVGVDDVDGDGATRNGAVQKHISHEAPVAFGINGHTLDVLCRFGDDKHRTPDASEVPVVGTALSQVHLWHTALLQHLHFEAVLLVAEEDTVGDINGMTGKAALIGAVACLATIDFHTNLRKGSLKDQLNLSSCPLLRQCELVLIQTFLIGNALGCGLAIETHAILIGAKPLQFPTGGHTNLRPLAAIATVCALEVPLHHIVTTATTQILQLRIC